MFVRIHFDAASLFPAMVIMTSIMTLRWNICVALEYNVASRLNGRYIKTFELLFEKNYKCIKMEKTNKTELKNIMRKRKCQLFFRMGCNVSEIVR